MGDVVHGRRNPAAENRALDGIIRSVWMAWIVERIHEEPAWWVIRRFQQRQRDLGLPVTDPGCPDTWPPVEPESLPPGFPFYAEPEAV